MCSLSEQKYTQGTDSVPAGAEPVSTEGTALPTNPTRPAHPRTAARRPRTPLSALGPGLLPGGGSEAVARQALRDQDSESVELEFRPPGLEPAVASSHPEESGDPLNAAPRSSWMSPSPVVILEPVAWLMKRGDNLFLGPAVSPTCCPLSHSPRRLSVFRGPLQNSFPSFGVPHSMKVGGSPSLDPCSPPQSLAVRG